MRFQKAKANGEVVSKDSYHQPGGGSIHRRSCGCDRTTEKGAYRDVSIELDDGTVHHYYHQSNVVTERPDGTFVLSSCGYQTRTTKERINSYLPSGYYVRQEDFTWYLETPEGREQFCDGMTVTP